MPVPAIVGLAALGGMVGKLVEKLVDFFFSQVARKIAIIGVVIAGVYAAVYLLLSTLAATITPLLQSLPPELSSIGMFLPSNTQACIAAVISIELAILTYSLTIKALNVKAKVA